VAGAVGTSSAGTPFGRYAVAVTDVLDDGPFFHGTAAPLLPGDMLTAGFRSNYRPEVVVNHVYFTALRDGAGLAAELAVELLGGGTPHVYEVEPTGAFENDPNVTDKKFPGNPTRSFRSAEPVRVVREVDDWARLTPEALAFWRERIISRAPEERGEILN
jgi:hypothetical protein